MKRVLVVFSAILIASMVLAACAPAAAPTEAPAAPAATEAPAAPAATEAPAAAAKQELNLWSFTNEMQTMALAYEKLHPDVKINYTMIPMTNGEYQTKLMATLGTDQVPCVVALEAAFVKSYVESDFLADLGALMPDAKAANVYPFVYEVGTDPAGVTKAYSYQATPGALFYRRSLAKEYFGTDDPAKIQEILGDMDKYTAAAEVVKQKSNGNTYMVASNGDFQNLFFANRAKPWVVDNTLTVDPMVDKMLATAKLFRDKGYEARATQWQEGWFAGMNDTLVDAEGNPKQIFSYFLPTWGLPYVLAPHAKSEDGTKDTSGDWGVINGPLPYQWGGTWMGEMKGCPTPELAQDFIKFATLDESNLFNWATGVYTNAYLKEIDPAIGDSQAQAPGDFVGSKNVVEKVIPLFDGSDLAKFLGGQNSYAGFAAAAPLVNAKLMQGSDDAIQRALNDPENAYLNGEITLDEMWATWKAAVKNEFPDLNIP